MSEFGDVEPEDAWDPGDPVDELVINLLRRAELLETGGPVDAILDALAARVALARARMLTPREMLRADDLDTDIAFVRGRL